MYDGIKEAAVLVDGGLSCKWPTVASTGLSLSRLGVVVLPDAEDLYARAKPSLTAREAAYMEAYTSFDYFDQTLVECTDTYIDYVGYVCRWQVLDDGSWFSIELGGVPETDYRVPIPRESPDTGVKPIEAVVDGSAGLGLVTSIVKSINAAPRTQIDHKSADFPACSSLIDTAALQPLASEPIEAVQNEPLPEQNRALWPVSSEDFSMERLTFRQCVVYAQSDWGVQFMVTTSLPWLLAPPFAAPRGTLETIDGLGTVYSSCGAGEDGESCSVTVVSDTAIVSMFMYDSQDPAVPVAVARSVIAALGR
jgi:hypothetical protein